MLELTIVDKEPLVDSRFFSKGSDIDHRSTFRLLTGYQNQLERLGRLRFKIADVRSKKTRRQQKYALLNEDQAIFLLTLSRNTEKVVDLKLNLTVAFKKYRDFVRRQLRQAEQRANLEWQQKRSEGKIARFEETDVIKEIVEYATAQGSKNARHYYSNLTRMTYKALFLVEQQFPNLRDWLNYRQLSNLQTAEYAVQGVLKEGMQNGLHYKEIYLLAKEKVISLADVLGQTRVLANAPKSSLEHQPSYVRRSACLT